ncbi:MAG TPA: Ig-like domain-containing protein [Thermomicrobiaceae bacterium]|nr:Ig-like domain-containing protein [Thermomicrobiaceae bacterium]
MRSRFLNLSATMGLVVSLFVALLGTPAVASAATAELPSSNVYFPFVPNGYSMNGLGPFTGSVTIQNLENARVTVTLTNNKAGKGVQTFDLNPHASATFGAGELSIDDGTVAGIVASAVFSAGTAAAGCVNPITRVVNVAHSGINNPDRISTDVGFTPISVTRVYSPPNAPSELPAPGGTIYLSGTDYTSSLTGASSDTASGSILIDWSSTTGAEPPVSVPADLATYTVVYQECALSDLATAPTPHIAGVEKHAAGGTAGTAGLAAVTSADNTVVDGYTGLSGNDLFSSTTALSSYVVPIVQNGWNGWDSTVFITNLSGKDNALATITFYTGGGQGAAGTSVGTFTKHLAKGETWAIDTSAMSSIPTGWVGSAWVSVDYPQVVVAVARNKAETSMSLTNTGEAATPSLSTGCAFNPATQLCRYAPLVFKNYNGWNTGINVANLGTQPVTVSVTYYNQQGDNIAQDQRTIPARAMEYIYRPSQTPQDIAAGTNQDNNLNAASAISGATITSTGPVHAAVDEVKYLGGPGMGQAMSYLAPSYGAAPGQSLALPLFQRGDATTGLGDTSGINMFNFGGPSAANVWFFDQSGALVAPTLNTPVNIILSPFANATVYGLNFDEMPVGFQGSAVVENVTPGGPEAAGGPFGQIAAVSNNVNYAVPFDGSAVYNLALVPNLVSLPVITCAPASATNVAGESHTVSCTVTIGGTAAAGVPVQFQVSGANPTAQVVLTDAAGKVSFTYTGFVAGNDTITATVLNSNLTPMTDAFGGVLASVALSKTYVPGAPAQVVCSPSSAINPPGQTHTVNCWVFDQFGNQIMDPGVVLTVFVQGRNNLGPAFVTTAVDPTTGDVFATFTYTDKGAENPSTPADIQDAINVWLGNQPNPLGTPDFTAYKLWTGANTLTGTLTPAPATVTTGANSVLTLTVNNASGQAFQGLNVTFGFCPDNPAGVTGTFSPTTGTTSASGQATTTFTAGNTTGVASVCAFFGNSTDILGSTTVNIVAANQPVSGTMTVKPAPFALSGARETITINVTNAAGTPAAGATVYYGSVSGANGPTCTPASGQATTDQNGNAQFQCTLAGSGLILFSGYAETNGTGGLQAGGANGDLLIDTQTVLVLGGGA